MKTNDRLDQQYLKTLTVLYVEDDGATRTQFAEFLSRPVGTLITAENGVEGLELFNKHRPDIVITDVQMPRMDGLTMAREIIEIAPKIPIIVITAFEQSDYLMRAINIGIDKYVTKPVNSYLLFAALLECTHRLRGEQQLKIQHERDIRDARSKQNETIAVLASGMVHDYNNLIQSILGYTSLALEKLEPGSASWKYLEKVETCSADAHELGKMLSIIGNGHTENRYRGPVIPCIIDAIEGVLPADTISFSCEIPEHIPDIDFSEPLIQLVFSGLAINAVEAMPQGGSLKLTVQTVTMSQADTVPLTPGAYMCIQLRDSGNGITPELLPTIFDPYFSTKQEGDKRGTGLNLALCQTAIMKSGGSIQAESTPGEGTTLSIWLPVPDGENDAA